MYKIIEGKLLREKQKIILSLIYRWNFSLLNADVLSSNFSSDINKLETTLMFSTNYRKETGFTTLDL